MAKSGKGRKGKKGSKGNPISLAALQQVPDKDFIIVEALIKDEFCNYKFELMKGSGKGRVHGVDGKNSGLTIKDDMKDAFANLNVHLAALDDIFKHAGVEVTNINDFHLHDLTHLYRVEGFKMKGSRDNETVSLIGTKHLSEAGGRGDITTPNIVLDSFSSYKWFAELKEAIEVCRTEVELYEGGKGIRYQEEDEEAPKDPDPNQSDLFVNADGITDKRDEKGMDDFDPEFDSPQ